jgi:hypothetical protein
MSGPEYVIEPSRSQPEIDKPAPDQAIDRAARRQAQIDAIRERVERDPRPQDPEIYPQLTP